MAKLYLDWNIITTLRQTDTLVNDEDRFIFKTLNEIIKSARKDLLIPYSDAHLKDLLKSYNKGERDRVWESLKYISTLTEDVCLTQYWNEEVAKWHIRNAKEFFESLVDDDDLKILGIESILEPLREFGMEKIFDTFKTIPHNIDFSSLQQHSPFFCSLLKRSQQEDSMYAVIEDFIDLVAEINSSPVVYNQLRATFSNAIPLDPNIHNVDNVIESLDKFLPKTMLNKSFTELYTDNNKTETSKNKEYSRIIGVFMQLDYIGFGSDKLNDKNQYANLFNDSLHCFYGAHCDFFITADKKTYKKTKAVYQSENITTQVMKPKEFIEYLHGLNK